MTLENLIEFRKMKDRIELPFLKIGMLVEVESGRGKITGSWGNDLWIKINGQRGTIRHSAERNIKYFFNENTLIVELK